MTAARNKWKYDRKNYDVKYWGFRFVNNDENENENENENEKTCLEVKPTFYNLDLNQVIGHEPIKETIIDTVS